MRNMRSRRPASRGDGARIFEDQQDLRGTSAFFVGLGLEVEGTGSAEGEFVETVYGVPGAHEIAM